ncbi:hypothetical protein BDP27DRAFT_1313041 [Rhodocollybia butyracea]|uniref:Ubiquitin 3 binding protein But2 C-terminal domain-containing protein n=1 Tax=Rhodocollybia butyracea TaxID=206335 RepID=A0A9P5QAX2_9AGAR|nr:hypothetical protein BDP27DRAFT_1313041 [Rhodocollybia butyracea]
MPIWFGTDKSGGIVSRINSIRGSVRGHYSRIEEHDGSASTNLASTTLDGGCFPARSAYSCSPDCGTQAHITPLEVEIHHFLSRWTVLVILICAIVDAILVMYMVLGSQTSVKSLSTLETRSPYVNFGDLYKDPNFKQPFHAPILALPRLSIPVSSSNPWKVFPPINDEAILTDRGFWINTEIHTILQFRVLDYGMENCSLALHIPPFTGVNASSGLVISELHSPIVDVWLLEAASKLDIHSLSWNTRPKRQAHIGTFNITYGSEQELEGLTCRSGSYITFELSCASVDCSIDIIRTARQATGFYMIQHQTK